MNQRPKRRLHAPRDRGHGDRRQHDCARDLKPQRTRAGAAGRVRSGAKAYRRLLSMADDRQRHNGAACRTCAHQLLAIKDNGMRSDRLTILWEAVWVEKP